jgi:O-antigen/teichoic acid export membrane protein
VSIAKRATLGALWSVGASVAARVIGLVGTLYMTRLLAPEVVGEVAAAAVIAQTSNWLSHWGFNQYMIVHGVGSPEKSWQFRSVLLIAICLNSASDWVIGCLRTYT